MFTYDQWAPAVRAKRPDLAESDIKSFFEQKYGRPASPQPEQPAGGSSIGRKAGDVATGLVTGAGSVAEGVGTLAGLTGAVSMNNPVRRAGAAVREFGEGLQSEDYRGRVAARRQAVDAEDGQFGKAMRAISETVSDPLLAGNFIAELVPQLLPGAAVARGAGAASRAAGLGTTGANRVAVGSAVATDVGLQAGDVAGGAYDRIMREPQSLWEQNAEYRELRSKIGDAQAKERVALSLARQVAAGAGLITGAVAALPGGRAIERMQAGVRTGTGRMLAGGAVGATGESLGEAIEEGGGQYLANRGVRAINPSQDLYEGVGESAGLGALGGGAMGGVAGAITSRGVQNPNTDPLPAEQPIEAEQPVNPGPAGPKLLTGPRPVPLLPAPQRELIVDENGDTRPMTDEEFAEVERRRNAQRGVEDYRATFGNTSPDAPRNLPDEIRERESIAAEEARKQQEIDAAFAAREGRAPTVEDVFARQEADAARQRERDLGRMGEVVQNEQGDAALARELAVAQAAGSGTSSPGLSALAIKLREAGVQPQQFPPEGLSPQDREAFQQERVFTSRPPGEFSDAFVKFIARKGTVDAAAQAQIELDRREEQRALGPQESDEDWVMRAVAKQSITPAERRRGVELGLLAPDSRTGQYTVRKSAREFAAAVKAKRVNSPVMSRKTREATDAEQVAEANAKFGLNLRPVDAQAVSVPTVGRAAARLAQEVFGKRVVFFEADKGPSDVNGFVDPDDPSTIFVNIRTDAAEMAVIGHEMLHALRRSRPEVYNLLRAQLRPLLKDYGPYKDWVNEFGKQPDHIVEEELIADLFGNQFMRQDFWDAVFKATKDPSLISRILDAVNYALTVVRLKLQMGAKAGFSTDQYVRDVDAARKAINDAGAAWAKAAQADRAAAPAPRTGAPALPSRKQADASGAFEVAPNPNDTPLKERWDALKKKAPEQADKVTYAASERFFGDVAQAVGLDPTKIILQNTFGGYGKDVNPSVVMGGANPAETMRLANALAYVFDQDSVLVMSDKPAPEYNKGQGLPIEFDQALPRGEVTPVYDAIIAAAPWVRGFTMKGSKLIILNEGKITDEMIGQVESGLASIGGGQAIVRDPATVYLAFPTPQGIQNEGDSIARAWSLDQRIVRQRLDRIRGEVRSFVAGKVNGPLPSRKGGGEQAQARGLQDRGSVRRSPWVLERALRPYPFDDETLAGLPSRVEVDGQQVRFGAFALAHEAARRYTSSAGIEYTPSKTFEKVDPARAKRIAQAYDEAKHAPNDPKVRASYDAMLRETVAQYQVVKETGLKVEFIDFAKTGDPYGNPRNAILDVVKNNHLWVFSTLDGFGTDALTAEQVRTNPLLADSGEVDANGRPMLMNDVFRAVHDYFGRVKDGVGFRADGEENAWRSHVAMYSPEARGAMTSETRGQNSWVNFGPYAKFNRTANGADTKYAEQKITLLPEWMSTDGSPLFSRKQTQTPEFRRWFGDSKVVDANGKPLVVYHGTYTDFSQFRGGGYFSADPEYASNTAELNSEAYEGNAQVMPVYLSLQNPAVRDVDFVEDLGYDGTAIAALKAQGYDGAMTADKSEIYAFRPEQIKSAIGNSGDFDPTKPSILASRKSTSPVDEAAQQAATSPTNDLPQPTQAQKEAGNYKVGAVRIGGLNIAIENPVGSTRQGVDADGRAWKRTMKSHYGYFRGVDAYDGDKLDVFVKPGTPTDYAGPYYVIDQNKANGQFDEHKVMLGWNTLDEAKAAYLENYTPGWDRAGAVLKADTVDDLKAWMEGGTQARGIDGARILFSRRAAEAKPVWYSALQRAVESKGPRSATPAEWSKFLTSGSLKQMGVKPAEVEWSGILDILDMMDGSKVKRENILMYLQDEGVKIDDVVLGEYEPEFTINSSEWEDEEPDPDWLKDKAQELMPEAREIRARRDGIRPEEVSDEDAADDARDMAIEDWYNNDPPRFQDVSAQRGDEWYDFLVRSNSAGTTIEGPRGNVTMYGRESAEYAIQRWLNEHDDFVPEDGISGQDEYRRWRSVPGGEKYRELLITLRPMRSPRSRAVDNAFFISEARRRAEGTYDDNNPSDQLNEREEAAVARAQSLSGEQPRFTPPHFENADSENTLAHVRFDRREYGGKNVLFIQEIQSDWAQQGKRDGFTQPTSDADKVEMARLRAAHDDIDDRVGMLNEGIRKASERGDDGDIEALSEQRKVLREEQWKIDAELKVFEDKVPRAPFITSTDAWVSLVLKRMIRWAADRDYDAIAWTTGEQQAMNYSSALRKSVRSLEWFKTPEGIHLIGWSADGNKVVDTTEKETRLSDAIGKQMADRIISDSDQDGIIEGEDIAISDTGMASFYDGIVPKIANEVLKKLGGGKVGLVGIGSKAANDASPFNIELEDGSLVSEQGVAVNYSATEAARFIALNPDAKSKRRTLEQPGFEITDQMRETALSGLPLFSRKSMGELHDKTREIPTLEWITSSQGVYETPDGRYRIERQPNGYSIYAGSDEVAEVRHLPHAKEVALAQFEADIVMNRIQVNTVGKGALQRYDEGQLQAVVQGWRALVQNRDNFEYRSTKATDWKGIVAGLKTDQGPQGIASVKPLGLKSAENSNGMEFKLVNAYLITLNSGKTSTLYETVDHTAWINTEPLKESGAGAPVYQTVFAWAANNRIKLIPDGTLTLVNTARRTEQMFSAALRLGTTKYMEPHVSQQLRGWISDPKTQLEEDKNLAILALDSMRNTSNAIEGREADETDATWALADAQERQPSPESDVAGYTGLEYNFASNQVENSDGTVAGSDETDAIIAAPSSRLLGVGMRTFVRGLVTRRLVAIGGAVPGDAPVRERVAEELALLRDRRLRGPGASDRPILYRRKSGPGGAGTGTGTAGSAVRETTAVGRSILSTARLAGRTASSAPVRGVAAGVDVLNRVAEAAIRLPANLLVRPVTSWIYDRVTGGVSRAVKRSTTLQEIALGLKADYGLPEPYIDARDDRDARVNKLLKQSKDVIDQIAGLDRTQARVAYLWMQEAPNTALENMLLAQLPADAVKSLDTMRTMIDAMGQEAVKLGLLSQDSYDRNKLAYLHRTYEKHELKDDAARKLADSRKAIRGDSYKGRGLRDDVKYDPSINRGDKLLRLELRDPPAVPGEKGKLRRKVYIPVGQPIPAQYSTWERDGIWEARFEDRDDKWGLWRDMNPQERYALGEIEEVRYAFARTMLASTQDIETARFLRWTATEYGKKNEAAVTAAGGFVSDPEKTKDGRNSIQVYADNEYVLVPETKVKGTKLMKYGDLAGQYVPGALWNDLRQAVNLTADSWYGRLWDDLLRGWKISKALALDTPIPTPTGWTTMGALKPGDAVFDEHGQPCQVLQATEVQHDHECYEVEFSDGTKIVADAGHLWYTEFRGKPGVRETREIAATLKERTRGDNNHRIPVAGALNLPDVALPIPPYALGVWLGDGDTRAARVSAGGEDAAELLRHLSASGVLCSEPAKDKRNNVFTFQLRRRPGKCLRGHDAVNISPKGCRLCANAARRGDLPPVSNPTLQVRMRDVGLLGNKHIPAIYLRASEQQRRELLMGLMDTDGNITESGLCTFVTTTTALRDGFLELARSLGYKPTLTEWQPTCNGKPGKLAWRMHFKAYADLPVFKLERKAARLQPLPETRQRSQTRQIVATRPVPSVPVRCILVSSSSHLFLAGDGMVPTHNTALSPAVHTNNIMANFVMADMADVGARDMVRALRVILDAQRGDANAKAVFDRFGGSGAEGGSFMSVELRRDVIEPLLAQLKREADGASASLSIIQALRMGTTTSMKMRLAWNSFVNKRGTQEAAAPFKLLIEAYRSEDTVFRLAKWLHETDKGVDDRQAGKLAKAAFLDYNINAPWIQALRRGPLPFVAFSYRIVPLLAQSIAQKPWKLMKYLAVGSGLNALAYAMLAAGGASADEDEERRLLPEEKQGRALGVFPRLVRMPWNDDHDSPVFLDVRRWIPGGDMFDVQGSQSAIPTPSWLSIGGPLALIIELTSNKSQFTGKPIWTAGDSDAQKIERTMDHLFKFMAPNLPIPNPVAALGTNDRMFQTFSWSAIEAVGSGKTDAFGRELSLPQALSSAVGVKLASYPRDVAIRQLATKRDAEIRLINERVADLRRQMRTNTMTLEEFGDKMRDIRERQARVREKFSEVVAQ